MIADVKMFAPSFIVNGRARIEEAFKEEESLAVRDALALLQDYHKRKVVRKTGDSKSAPLAAGMPWTSRSGGRGLLGSYHTYWRKGDLVGYYGSELPRAKVQEEGGEINPRGKYLAIPTDKAPKKVWPRYVEDLFFLPLKGKKAEGALARTRGKTYEVLYWLVPSVTLPARPTLEKAMKDKEAEISMIFFRAIGRAWDREE